MKEVVIINGCRTAIGAYGGTLQSTPVAELGAISLKGTLKKAGLRPVTSPERYSLEPDALKGKGMIDLEKQYHDYESSLQPIEIDQVILGNVLGAGINYMIIAIIASLGAAVIGFALEIVSYKPEKKLA